MKLSVIIVNYNVKYFLEVCLDSVMRAMKGLEGEIIVVDNNSQDGSCEWVRGKFPSLTLIENKDNKGFSKANNQGATIAKGEYVLFLNPDTVMPEDFFHKMISYMDAHPEAGAIGPRLIDGKGAFAPDSKKSFPTLSVAIFKTIGLHKIFSRSAYFNKYYAVHIKECQLAEVEVLSGCCMMVRRKIFSETGGAFDEDYFMYCEDVDLSYRIQKAGYKNIYFPEAVLVHYKGESTRKATLTYVRTFNEALATFVKKHYRSGHARMFIFLIQTGIILKAVLGVFRRIFKVIRMPMLDTIVLLAALWLIKDFYVEQIKNMLPIATRSLYFTVPVYTLIWVFSLFLNGAYDEPYRPSRLLRGMLIGTIICLAYFGLLPSELRYSRAIIVITGVSGAVILMALHELYYRLGIFKTTRYDSMPNKAVIVAEEAVYENTAAILEKVHYAPEVYGRISTKTSEEKNALASVDQLQALLYTAGIHEVIFCVNGLSYQVILEQMQRCGDQYDYKIHLPGSSSFVGSNSSNTAGDLYTLDKRFNMAQFAQLRNKRVMDITISILLLIGSPLLLFFIKSPLQFLSNCLQVLTGRKTWVGYETKYGIQKFLPPVRKSILPPFSLLKDFQPNSETVQQLNLFYAQHFSASNDFGIVIKNFRFLGRKSEKDFAKNE